MPQFRKRPVVVDAVQWFPGVDHPGVKEATYGFPVTPEEGHTNFYVMTIHGQRSYLAPGDWILPEPQEGRFYPCKPDIFAAIYEPVL